MTMNKTVRTEHVGQAVLDAIRLAVRQEFEALLQLHQIGAKSQSRQKAFLTVKEAADFSRIAPSTIRLYIRKRRLRAQKVGRRVIIRISDLEEFLTSNPIEIASDKFDER